MAPTSTSLAPQRDPRLENMILDVFMVNDEIAMMRYRLKLHAPIALRTLVVESRYTFTGQPKPLLARSALSAAEIAAYRIRLLEINPDVKRHKHLLRVIDRDGTNSTIDAAKAKKVHLHTGGTLDSAFFIMEHGQRERLSYILRNEVQDLRRAHGSDFLVFVSDVDEMLQAELLLQASILTCRTPTLRHYHYGVHCAAYKPVFARSLVFRASSPWLNFSIEHRRIGFYWDPLRNMVYGRAKQGICPATRSYVGWHLSYFLSTEQILTKLRSFSHASDPFVAATLASRDAPGLIAHRVRRCISTRGDRLHAQLLPFSRTSFTSARDVKRYSGVLLSGVLPSLSGWPQHRDAATAQTFGDDALGKELGRCEALAKEVAQSLEQSLEAARMGHRNASLEYVPGWWMWGSANLPSAEQVAVSSAEKAALQAAQRHYDVTQSCMTLRRLQTLRYANGD